MLRAKTILMTTLSVGPYISSEAGMNYTLLVLERSITENKSIDDMKMNLE